MREVIALDVVNEMVGFEKMIGWSTMSKRLKWRVKEREGGGGGKEERERESRESGEREVKEKKKGNRKRHGTTEK